MSTAKQLYFSFTIIFLYIPFDFTYTFSCKLYLKYIILLWDIIFTAHFFYFELTAQIWATYYFLYVIFSKLIQLLGTNTL